MVVAVGTRSVTPGKETEWEALWMRMHELAQQRKGFHSARLLKSSEHLGKYTLLAEWDSKEAWERYYESAEMQALTQESFLLFQGVPLQEWHVVLQEVGRAPSTGR